MKFFCVADKDTVLGFRLAGIESRAVETPEQAQKAISEALAEPNCGIVILNEQVAGWIRPQIDKIRMEVGRPLIVEIPGPEGPMEGRKSLREFVQEAVGISVY
ncbi:MAG: V-type ATP synthase subunit F [Syntrophorhabdaceae bacterium]|nr:V-type ATP synthase subunit F [Syntrophorhabdales bacterium]MBP9560558.1 V-type ATP synthase subunit F [Syntrophorhabdaceae bacterium]